MSLPKPYYEKSGITIYHGDCREILPYLPKVDLVLTDPPYGIEFRSNHRFIRHDRIQGDECLPIRTIKDLIKVAVSGAYFFCRWDQIKLMPPPKSVIAWVKNNWSMGDLEHEHGRQWEACCFYNGPEHRFIKRISDVIFAARTGNNLHPTEKPLALMRTIIGANYSDTIFDPFMGSGTTLRAARDLERQAIGIEIEEKYCEIAANRVNTLL